MCFRKRKKDNIEPFISHNTEPYISQNSVPYASYNTASYTSRDTKSYEPQSTDFSRNFNYDFTLTEFGGKIEGGFREINNPTEADLKNAVDNLALYDGEMFTLISNEPVNGLAMLGGTILYGDEQMTATVHIEAGVKGGKRLGKAYDKHVTPEQMLALLTDYLNCRTPNIHDGTWVFDEDINYPD